eukprot:TRINITY_DN3047_c0_g1_i1.p1 TRINITY_DN3047_c0_g1~~TRINITY_DN3047_c0_g1_i1.p1  ORF type:complete len:625 (+),score=149.60 TRINITY_DN3047_c0_g1_i1:1725-3599(+)
MGETLESLWAKVRSPEHSGDFSMWQDLAKAAEAKGLDAMREAFGALLVEWPLCYGYWRKWSNKEVEAGNVHAALQIMQDAVTRAPFVHELWTHYCTIAIDSRLYDEDSLRSLFEAAVDRVGSDFNSEQLWNKYLEFETLIAQRDGNHARVLLLFLRIISLPLKNLEEFYNRFKVLALGRQADELLISEDERASLNLNEKKTELEKRQAILDSRDVIFQQALAEKRQRSAFEAAIKRPYFHVKPLTSLELDNWNAYLDFEENLAEKDPTSSWRVVKLFERALIAAANYPEMWVRYAKYAELISDPATYDAVFAIYERAMTVFVKKRPEIYFAFADFQETCGNIPEARQALQKVASEISPSSVECKTRMSELEIRQNDHNAAIALFEELLEGFTSDSVDEVEHSNLGLIGVRYAALVEFAQDKPEEARNVYKRVASKIRGTPSFWLSFCQFEARHPGFDMEARLQSVIDEALSRDSSQLSRDDRTFLWKHFLPLGRRYFSSMVSIKALENRYVKEVRTGASNRRNFSCTLGLMEPADVVDDAQPRAKRAKTGSVDSGHMNGGGGSSENMIPVAPTMMMPNVNQMMAAGFPQGAAAGYPQAAYPPQWYQGYPAAAPNAFYPQYPQQQ